MNCFTDELPNPIPPEFFPLGALADLVQMGLMPPNREVTPENAPSFHPELGMWGYNLSKQYTHEQIGIIHNSLFVYSDQPFECVRRFLGGMGIDIELHDLRVCAIAFKYQMENS
jgi:hypothetical protein